MNKILFKPLLKYFCRKLMFSVTCIILTLFCWQESIQACSCYRGDFIDAFNSTTMVFVGKPVKSTEVEVALPDEPKFHRIMYDFDFKVLKILKGNQLSEIRVRTGSGGGDCGYGFDLNREYLVFTGFYKGQWNTSICTHTVPKDSFAYEAKMLRLSWEQNPALRTSRPVFSQIDAILKNSEKPNLSCDNSLRTVLSGKKFYFVLPIEFKYNDPIDFKKDGSAEYSYYEFKNFQIMPWRGKCTIFLSNTEGGQYRLLLNSDSSVTLLEIWNNAGQKDEAFFDRGKFYTFPDNITQIDIMAFTLYNRYRTENSKKGF